MFTLSFLYVLLVFTLFFHFVFSVILYFLYIFSVIPLPFHYSILSKPLSFLYVFFNNYFIFIFIILQKYWDRRNIGYKSHIISLSSFLCLAVASVCLIIFRPLWQNFEKEFFNISTSLPEKETAEIVKVTSEFYRILSIYSQIPE